MEQQTRFLFGSTQAAKNLAAILEELNDSGISAKVTRCISERNHVLNVIRKQITDLDVRKTVILMMIRNMELQLVLPKLVYTHTRNVLIATLREALHECKRKRK